MERLTDKMLTKACNDPWDYCGLDAHCTRHCTQPTPCKIPALVHRLAKIENILGDNYDLDRLRELVEADREGRCVVLPCKLGDTVYFITGTYNSLVKPAKVEEIYIGDGSIALGVSTDFTTFTLQESEWHLTRAEAEAALKAREQDE